MPATTINYPNPYKYVLASSNYTTSPLPDNLAPFLQLALDDVSKKEEEAAIFEAGRRKEVFDHGVKEIMDRELAKMRLKLEEGHESKDEMVPDEECLVCSLGCKVMSGNAMLTEDISSQVGSQKCSRELEATSRWGSGRPQAYLNLGGPSSGSGSGSGSRNGGSHYMNS